MRTSKQSSPPGGQRQPEGGAVKYFSCEQPTGWRSQPCRMKQQCGNRHCLGWLMTTQDESVLPIDCDLSGSGTREGGAGTHSEI